MIRLAALLFAAILPGLAMGATTTVSRAVVANTNNVIISHTNLTLNGTATVHAVKFSDATAQTTAALPLTGGTMTGGFTNRGLGEIRFQTGAGGDKYIFGSNTFNVLAAMTLSSRLDGYLWGVSSVGAITGASLSVVGGVSASSFTGNGAGLTNLPVYAGAGVTISQTSTGIVAANVYAPFYTVLLTTPTNEVRIAIPSNSAASGVEVDVSGWSTNNEAGSSAFWQANGLAGTATQYGLFYSQWNVAAASGSISNNASGGTLGPWRSPNTMHSARARIVLRVADMHDPSPTKSWWADNLSCNAPGFASTGVVAQILRGTYIMGGSLTQVTILVTGTAMQTGTLVQARYLQ